jgi:hypothetical protein
MNQIALRLHEIGLQLEGSGMDEIVAALGVAEREIERLQEGVEALKDANEKCRSAYAIAERITEQYGETYAGINFGAFKRRVHESLVKQRAVLESLGAYSSETKIPEQS